MVRAIGLHRAVNIYFDENCHFGVIGFRLSRLLGQTASEKGIRAFLKIHRHGQCRNNWATLPESHAKHRLIFLSDILPGSSYQGIGGP